MAMMRCATSDSGRQSLGLAALWKGLLLEAKDKDRLTPARANQNLWMLLPVGRSEGGDSEWELVLTARLSTCSPVKNPNCCRARAYS